MFARLFLQIFLNSSTPDWCFLRLWWRCTAPQPPSTRPASTSPSPDTTRCETLSLYIVSWILVILSCLCALCVCVFFLLLLFQLDGELCQVLNNLGIIQRFLVRYNKKITDRSFKLQEAAAINTFSLQLKDQHNYCCWSLNNLLIMFYWCQCSWWVIVFICSSAETSLIRLEPWSTRSSLIQSVSASITLITRG